MSLKVKNILCRLQNCAGMMALAALVLSFPRMARADGLNGFLEWNYSRSGSSVTDSTGTTTRGTSDSFSHRYSLNAQKTIYPSLTFSAGGLFDQQIGKVSGDPGAAGFASTVTKMSPYAGLSLNNSFGTAGFNYYRREEEGSGGAANVSETYSLSISSRERKWLPPVNFLFTRSNLFDTEHLLQDLTTDMYSFGTRYRPVQNLDLTYQGTYTDATNRLQSLESTMLTQSGRISYSRQFFENRITMATTYSITGQSSLTTGTGNGEVFLQVFPFSGLSVISDTPQLIQMSDNPSLINGDLTTGSGINIGVPPLGGDTKPRNIGVDFVNPSRVDTVRIWLNQALPAQIASRFAWDVYVSSDNLNWTLVQSLPNAPFGQFENRFELRINPVTTRYLKVVVRPLPVGLIPIPGVDLANIAVTEVQTFLSKQAGEVKGVETSSTSQLYTFNTRAKLLSTEALYYDMNLTWNQSSTGQASSSRYLLSNALSINHAFNRIFTGNARVSREDSNERSGSRVAYLYTGSLSAVPLPTLNHTLVYSGMDENIAGKTKLTNSIFLNNSAELYRGVNVNLSGGYSTSSSGNGEASDNTTLSGGILLVPLPVLSINLNYSTNASNSSGGSNIATSTFTQRGEASVSLNPVRSIYLFGSVGVTMERHKDPITTETFGGTWSPFRDGTLQLNVAYGETLTSAANQKDRTISPTLRWNIRGGSFLMLSYTNTHSESITQTADVNSVSAGLRFSF